MAARRPPAKKAPAKKSPPKRTVTKQAGPKREDQVLKLRNDGTGFEAIAKELRFRDAAGAHSAYERALAKSLPDPPEVSKRAELERIRKAEEKLWPVADRGNLAAIARLVLLDLERQAVTRDQLVLAVDEAGPIETATAVEVHRLADAAPALAATALVLARTVDATSEPGPRATVARELRMHMAQLRGLAGTNPAYTKPPATQPPTEAGDGEGGKPDGGGAVVPESKLDELRRRAAARAREGGAG